MTLSAKRGMHRFSWDMHYDPIGGADGVFAGGDDAVGVVPHRTYPDVNSPWAAPGSYTVRLTANGTSYTQPLTVRMDPRVKTSAADLARLASLSREMYDGAVALQDAYRQARALSGQLGSLQGPDLEAFKAQLDSLAPAPGTGARGGFGGGRRGPAAASSPTLVSAAGAMVGAGLAIQKADVAPTAAGMAAAARARAQTAAVLSRWNTLKTSGLGALNTRRRAAGQPVVTIPGA
jgi:hypothetical protein